MNSVLDKKNPDEECLDTSSTSEAETQLGYVRSNTMDLKYRRKSTSEWLEIWNSFGMS